MKMNNELRNHWNSLLQPVFPAGTKFDVDLNTSDFRAEVRWKVGTDPDRPNKMSKTIFIIVPGETENDYANKNDARRQSDDMKLLGFVESNFDNHNPDYDSLKGVQPPEVKWVAGSNVLNS